MSTSPGPSANVTRRNMLGRTAGVLATGGLLAGLGQTAEAKDYTSRRQALDELDRLAAICGMRLGMVRQANTGADLLVLRFLNALARDRATRDDVRRRFALPPGLDPASQIGEVDSTLEGLRQALDDLMVAYAESLPVFGDASVVSRLAVDMVEVSKLRTVIDLWASSEAS